MVYRFLTKLLGFTGFILIISGIVCPFVTGYGEYFMIGDADILGSRAGMMKYLPFIGVAVAGFGVFAGLIMHKYLKYAALAALGMLVLMFIGFNTLITGPHPLLLDSVVIERGLWVWLMPAAAAAFALAALVNSVDEKREQARRRY
ncbi:MAG: hypothetical protein LIO85_11020 [Rikenellaceae bacterium]|nr:hypothetical protein [Rikenellaceae bacterium]